MSLSLLSLYQRLDPYPGLKNRLTFAGLVKFIKCAALCHEDILLTQAGQHPADVPPQFLSRALKQFLSKVSGLSQDDVNSCWEAYKDIIWEGEVPHDINTHPLDEFKQHGHAIGLSEYSCFNAHFLGIAKYFISFTYLSSFKYQVSYQHV